MAMCTHFVCDSWYIFGRRFVDMGGRSLCYMIFVCLFELPSFESVIDFFPHGRRPLGLFCIMRGCFCKYKLWKCILSLWLFFAWKSLSFVRLLVVKNWKLGFWAVRWFFNMRSFLRFLWLFRREMPWWCGPESKGSFHNE